MLVDTTERRRVDELEWSRELIIDAEEQLRREIAEQLRAGVQTKLLLAWYRLTKCSGVCTNTRPARPTCWPLSATTGGDP